MTTRPTDERAPSGSFQRVALTSVATYTEWRGAVGSSTHPPCVVRSTTVDPADGTQAPSAPTREDATPRALVVAAVAAALLFLTVSWVTRPFVGGDTPFVLDGTNAFLQCMDARVFVGCGHTAS